MKRQMRNLVRLLTAILFIFSMVNSVFSQVSPSGNIMLEMNGEYGFTVTSKSGVYKEENGDGASGWFGNDIGAGMKIGYCSYNWLIVYSGFDIQKRNLYVNTLKGGFHVAYSQKYFEIPAVLRFHMFDMIYIDAGAFYGIKFGSTKESGDLSGINRRTKNDYGYLFGAGYLIPLFNENNRIDIGFRSRFGHPWAISEDGGKVKSMFDLTLNAGYALFF
jgi:hypothetical protein